MRPDTGKFAWSRLGLALAGAYFLLTVLAIAAALWEPGDPKGRFILLQLPIALQLAALPASLLRQWSDMSWPMAYLVIWPPTALGLYTFGHGIGHLLKPRPN